MLISQARECIEQLSTFRRKRNRCRDYTFGRQWNDIIEVDGRPVTEYEYIMSEGNVPLKNNLIRRIVRNVLGLFRARLPEIMENHYSGNLAETAENNRLEELFARTMEEFLISGMAVHRKRVGVRDGVQGVWTEVVSPGNFFFNTDSRDIRGRDLHIVGQTHSVGFHDWCKAFVKTPDDYRRVHNLFETNGGRPVKIIEIWRREMMPCCLVHHRDSGRIAYLPEKAAKESGLPSRWMLREVWRYYFLREDGEVVCEGDSPFPDRSHPYIMKCYPYLDGEIHSFVGDMIDQQRYTNRLITLFDWVIRASAKGVLLIPEGAVDPRDMRDVADAWGRFNGVIVYKAKAENPEPKQISGNMSNLGISELLEIQLKMLEDVSGVNGILQGNTSGGNVSGTLYESQTTNAMYSLSDLLETYETFIADSAAKDRMMVGGRTSRASLHIKKHNAKNKKNEYPLFSQ